jgi:hypothetical protein
MLYAGAGWNPLMAMEPSLQMPFQDATGITPTASLPAPSSGPLSSKFTTPQQPRSNMSSDSDEYNPDTDSAAEEDDENMTNCAARSNADRSTIFGIQAFVSWGWICRLEALTNGIEVIFPARLMGGDELLHR